MTTILHPAPVSARLFFWDGYHGSAEASSLGIRGFGRVYDDACDEGLTLVSSRTGREVVFRVERTHVRDGDITHWTLVPAGGRTAYGAALELTIFND